MPLVTGKRLEFRFPSLEVVSDFLRHLHLHDRDSALAEAAKAHFNSFSVSVTLFREDDGEAVREEAIALGGTELKG